MTNKEVASQFKLLGGLMELHNENPFKVRSYNNAYLTLRKLPQELSELDDDSIAALPGVGKAISTKIRELLDTGQLSNVQKYLDMTPPGIVDMLGIKGLGAKKIRVIWKELEVESPGELMYAINENRLLDLKGFGAKTQENIRQQLAYFIESEGKQLYARIVPLAETLMDSLIRAFPDNTFSLAGEVHMKNPVISEISVLGDLEETAFKRHCAKLDYVENDGTPRINGTPLVYYYTQSDSFFYTLVKHSSGTLFFDKLGLADTPVSSEQALFDSAGIPFYIPEFREDHNADLLDQYGGPDNIITVEDIRGCIHNHSTFSDGVNSIEEMLKAAMERKYEYFVMTDHSTSAFYANGLETERLLQQGDAIRALDQKYPDIRFFSGIESDILSDGSLDYPDDILAGLDLVIASVHSNLKMDREKATQRILNAVENPYTSILGHPTGRLLLSRQGYPLDFKKIIDACSAHNVAIEINANPLRLDLDWRHIQYAMSKNVLLSVNPDAHSTKGIDDTLWGVWAARKGGLLKSYCLNAMPLDEFEEWLAEQHDKRP